MTGRATLVTVGAFALAMLGFAAVASADEPKGGGPEPGPTPEDCAQARAERSALQNQRAGLNDQLVQLQEAALLAGQAGEPTGQLIAEVNAVRGQIAQVNEAIDQLTVFINQECE